ncbi:MAG: hypothetical protein FJY80_01565 [Candidatus Aminicenantes bacterium]|nr:hypothetical protein [Candidatus Aminicenantes bacterium]
MPKAGCRVLRATFAVWSNRKELLPSFPLKAEVPSLLTDFKSVDPIPCPVSPDGTIFIEDRPGRPTARLAGRRASFRGPFRRLAREASDARFGFWGNQGFLYRFALRLLEERHGVFSLHAAGLVDERGPVLYVVIGGAGSGKTVFLLSGLARGLKLFSTETVHFRPSSSGRLRWDKGSVIDNVRLGTLVHDFPDFRPPNVAKSGAKDLWTKKIALDLGAFASTEDVLVDPDLVLLFPRVEAGRRSHIRRPVGDPRTAAKAFFDNMSQKIGESFLLYDRLALPGQDTSDLAAARLRAAKRLARHPSVRLTASVLAGPERCWGDLVDKI